jgi:hypothetical protein
VSRHLLRYEAGLSALRDLGYFHARTVDSATDHSNVIKLMCAVPATYFAYGRGAPDAAGNWWRQFLHYLNTLPISIYAALHLIIQSCSVILSNLRNVFEVGLWARDRKNYTGCELPVPYYLQLVVLTRRGVRHGDT